MRSRSDVPLMTLPTPISVLKGPRPLEESNLEIDQADQVSPQDDWPGMKWAGVCGHHVLLASEVIFGALGLVVEISSVLDGDGSTLLGLVGTVALGDDLPGDTHFAGGAGVKVARKAAFERVKME